MDYNRVQSYIKSHVLPKLDSLPQDVQSVKQAFDAWKADWTQARAAKLDNLDATISSRASSQQVDGVRGGVDTTLTKLATLEGSVEAVKPIANDVIKILDVANKSGSLLNVSGMGKLLAVLNYDANVDLLVDGVKKVSLQYTNGSGRGSYICSQHFKGFEYGASSNNSARYALTSFGCSFFDNVHFDQRNSIIGLDLNATAKTITNGVGVTVEPISFAKSLEIKTTSGTATAVIAYTLD